MNIIPRQRDFELPKGYVCVSSRIENGKTYEVYEIKNKRMVILSKRFRYLIFLFRRLLCKHERKWFVDGEHFGQRCSKCGDYLIEKISKPSLYGNM